MQTSGRSCRENAEPCLEMAMRAPHTRCHRPPCAQLRTGAGDRVRRGFSAQALLALECWIVRSSRTMTLEEKSRKGAILTPAPIVIKHNYSGQEPIRLMGNAASATAGQSELLEIERRGAVLTVGLNRPAKRNALNDGIILAIQDCFSNLPDGIGAVVVHGIGDHFSSGLDLSELTEQDATEGLRHSQMWHRVFDRIQYSRVPVIAALKGAVIGGGLELACAAHIRVAEPSAYFALPEGQRGIFVG